MNKLADAAADQEQAMVTESSGPAPGFERLPVALFDCDVLIIACALLEFEKPTLQPDTWPAAPRIRIERVAREWTAAHPERVVRLISTGAVPRGALPGCCFMALHHAPRGADQ